MALTLPPQLMALFKGLTGMEWPQANEDQLRAVAALYDETAKYFPQLADLFAQVVKGVRSEFSGAAADAFVAAMQDFIGGDKNYLGVAADQAQKLGQFAKDTANQVEYTKWMIIAQLIQLAVEIAIAIALAPFTFGASMANLTWEYALTRAFIYALFRFLLKALITHTVLGVGLGFAMDRIIQEIQKAQHHRSSIDSSLTKQAVEFGAIAGALGGPISLLGEGLGKILGNLVGKGLGSFITKDLAKLFPDALGNTLTKDASHGLAKDMGKLFANTAPQLLQGFDKLSTGGPLKSISSVFVTKMGSIFQQHFGAALGQDAAKVLGEKYGQAFVTHWGAKDLSAVKQELATVLAKSFDAKGVDALAKNLPDVVLQNLSSHLDGNLAYKLGAMAAGTVTDGIHQNLTEGFYNLIFGPNHQFTTTWGTFVSGMAMGGLGRGGHQFVAGPLSHKLTSALGGPFEIKLPGFGGGAGSHTSDTVPPSHDSSGTTPPPRDSSNAPPSGRGPVPVSSPNGVAPHSDHPVSDHPVSDHPSSSAYSSSPASTRPRPAGGESGAATPPQHNAQSQQQSRRPSTDVPPPRRTTTESTAQPTAASPTGGDRHQAPPTEITYGPRAGTSGGRAPTAPRPLAERGGPSTQDNIGSRSTVDHQSTSAPVERPATSSSGPTRGIDTRTGTPTEHSSGTDKAAEQNQSASHVDAPSQRSTAERIASYRPDPALGEHEGGRWHLTGEGEQGTRQFVQHTPSNVVHIRVDDTHTVGLTPVMARKWLADNGIHLPKYGGVSAAVERHLYDQPSGDRLVYGIDDAHSFHATVSAKAGEQHLADQQHVMDAVNDLSDWITEKYPPGEHSYVGLGRSPAPIVAALQSLGHDAATVPLSSFRPSPRDPNSIVRAPFVQPDGKPNPSLTPEQQHMLTEHFDEFLGGLPKHRDIVLIDYTQSGLSLIAAQHYLQEHVRTQWGSAATVHALAMHQHINTHDLGRTVDSIVSAGSFLGGLNERFWDTGRGLQRAQWQDHFATLSLGSEGPLGDHGPVLGEAFKAESFDGLSEFGSYKILEQPPESFATDRPRRDQAVNSSADAPPSAYQVLRDAVVDAQPVFYDARSVLDGSDVGHDNGGAGASGGREPTAPRQRGGRGGAATPAGQDRPNVSVDAGRDSGGSQRLATNPFGLSSAKWEALRNTATPVTRQRVWGDPGAKLAELHQEGVNFKDKLTEFANNRRDNSNDTIIRSAYDVRRIGYRGQQATEVTVRVAFSHAEGLGESHVAEVWSKLTAGVQEHFNAPGHQFRTGPVGDTLVVRVERVNADENPHLSVLVSNDSAVRTDKSTWRVGRTAEEYAHEFGHQLGLPDEHGDRAEPDRGQAAGTGDSLRPLDVPGSLMGDYHQPAPAGLAQSGLRSRHLDLLGMGIGHDISVTRFADNVTEHPATGPNTRGHQAPLVDKSQEPTARRTVAHPDSKIGFTARKGETTRNWLASTDEARWSSAKDITPANTDHTMPSGTSGQSSRTRPPQPNTTRDTVPRTTTGDPSGRSGQGHPEPSRTGQAWSRAGNSSADRADRNQPQRSDRSSGRAGAGNTSTQRDGQRHTAGNSNGRPPRAPLPLDERAVSPTTGGVPETGTTRAPDNAALDARPGTRMEASAPDNRPEPFSAPRPTGSTPGDPVAPRDPLPHDPLPHDPVAGNRPEPVAGLSESGGHSPSRAMTADLFGDVAHELGLSVAELELRVTAAEPALMGAAFDMPDKSLSEAYSEMLARFAGSCGATSDMLKDLFFAGAPTHVGTGMGALRDALRAPGDAVLRVNLGTHSFFVEKRADKVHVLQSYLGKESLQQSIDRNLVLPVSEFVGKLDAVVAHYDGTVHQYESELFGGQAFNAESVAKDRIGVEVSTDIAGPGIRQQRLKDLLAREDAAWTEAKNSQKLTSQWLEEKFAPAEDAGAGAAPVGDGGAVNNGHGAPNSVPEHMSQSPHEPASPSATGSDHGAGGPEVAQHNSRADESARQPTTGGPAGGEHQAAGTPTRADTQAGPQPHAGGPGGQPGPHPPTRPPTESAGGGVSHATSTSEVPLPAQPAHHVPSDGPPTPQVGVRHEYVPPPSHVGAEDARVPQWHQAQNDLHSTYDERLTQAESAALAKAEGERRFDETFNSWAKKQPPGTTEEFLATVRDRAHEEFDRRLDANPDSHPDIFAGLADSFDLASVRQAAIDRGGARFESVFQAWQRRLTNDSLPVEFDLSPEALGRVHDHMHTVWDRNVEASVHALFATPRDVHENFSRRVEQANRRLEVLSSGFHDSLDLRAGYETVMTPARQAFAHMQQSWRDHLNEGDRVLLAELGVQNAKLSTPSLELLNANHRDQLDTHFAEVFGSTDSAGHFGRNLRGSLGEWQRRFAQVAGDLPHQFAHQAAREALITKVTTAVDEAAGSWHEALSRLGPEVTSEFGLAHHEVSQSSLNQLKQSLSRTIDDQFHGELGGHGLSDTASGGPGQRWRNTLAELTNNDRLHEDIAVRAGRESALAAARQHATDELLATQYRTLSGDASDRVRTGFEERAAGVFDTVFRGGFDSNSQVLREQLSQWQTRYQRLRKDLPADVIFEAHAHPALTKAGEHFGAASNGRKIDQSTLDGIAENYRTDWFTRYQELWGPPQLRTESWLDHEAAHENAFDLARRPPTTSHAPPSYPELALIRHDDARYSGPQHHPDSPHSVSDTPGRQSTSDIQRTNTPNTDSRAESEKTEPPSPLAALVSQELTGKPLTRPARSRDVTGSVSAEPTSPHAASTEIRNPVARVLSKWPETRYQDLYPKAHELLFGVDSRPVIVPLPPGPVHDAIEQVMLKSHSAGETQARALAQSLADGLPGAGRMSLPGGARGDVRDVSGQGSGAGGALQPHSVGGGSTVALGGGVGSASVLNSADVRSVDAGGVGAAESRVYSEVRGLLDGLSGITVFVDDAANFGHQAAATMLMASVRELGYRGDFTVVAPANVREKLQLLVPVSERERLTWVEGELDFEAPRRDPREDGGHGPGSSLVLVAASDRLDSNLATASAFLDFLGTDRAIVLRPYAWSESTRLLYTREGPGSVPMVRSLEPSSTVGEQTGSGVAPISAGAMYHFDVPRLEPSAVKALISEQMSGDVASAEGLRAIVDAVAGGVELMPVYGLHNLSVGARATALSTLAAGVHDAALGRPAIVLEVGNSTVDFAPEYAAEWLVRASLSDPGLADRIAGLGGGSVLVVRAGALPQDVFRQVYQLGSLPGVLEGANTTNLVALIGRPFFSALTTRTPYDNHDPAVAQRLGQVTSAIGHESQWAEEVVYEPLFQRIEEADTALSVLRSLLKAPNDVGVWPLTADEMVRLRKVLDEEEITRLVGDVPGVADVLGYDPNNIASYRYDENGDEIVPTVTIPSAALQALQARVGQVRQEFVAALRARTTDVSIEPDPAQVSVIAKAIAEVGQSGTGLHQYFLDVAARAQDPANDQVLQALRHLLPVGGQAEPGAATPAAGTRPVNIADASQTRVPDRTGGVAGRSEDGATLDHQNASASTDTAGAQVPKSVLRQGPGGASGKSVRFDKETEVRRAHPEEPRLEGAVSNGNLKGEASVRPGPATGPGAGLHVSQAITSRIDAYAGTEKIQQIERISPDVVVRIPAVAFDPGKLNIAGEFYELTTTTSDYHSPADVGELGRGTHFQTVFSESSAVVVEAYNYPTDSHRQRELEISRLEEERRRLSSARGRLDEQMETFGKLKGEREQLRLHHDLIEELLVKTAEENLPMEKWRIERARRDLATDIKAVKEKLTGRNPVRQRIKFLAEAIYELGRQIDELRSQQTYPYYASDAFLYQWSLAHAKIHGGEPEIPHEFLSQIYHQHIGQHAREVLDGLFSQAVDGVVELWRGGRADATPEERAQQTQAFDAILGTDNGKSVRNLLQTFNGLKQLSGQNAYGLTKISVYKDGSNYNLRFDIGTEVRAVGVGTGVRAVGAPPLDSVTAPVAKVPGMVVPGGAVPAHPPAHPVPDGGRGGEVRGHFDATNAKSADAAADEKPALVGEVHESAPAAASGSSGPHGVERFFADTSFRSSEADRTRFRDTYENYEYYAPEVRELVVPDERFSSIAEEDLVAVHAYTKVDFYAELNQALRTGDEEALTRFTPFIHSLTSGLNQMPVHQGVVVRGIDVQTEDMAGFLARYTPGATVTEPSFISGAVESISTGNVRFIVHSSSGHAVRDVSLEPRYTEAVFTPGAKFKVVFQKFDAETAHETGGVWTIGLIDQAPEQGAASTGQEQLSHLRDALAGALGFTSRETDLLGRSMVLADRHGLLELHQRTEPDPGRASAALVRSIDEIKEKLLAGGPQAAEQAAVRIADSLSTSPSPGPARSAPDVNLRLAAPRDGTQVNATAGASTVRDRTGSAVESAMPPQRRVEQEQGPAVAEALAQRLANGLPEAGRGRLPGGVRSEESGSGSGSLGEGSQQLFESGVGGFGRVSGDSGDSASASLVVSAGGRELWSALEGELNLSAGVGVGSGVLADAMAPILGPDVFGVRQAPPAPDFLRGYDFSLVKADQRSALYDALNLTREAPGVGALAPSALRHRPDRVTVSGEQWVRRGTNPWLPKRPKIPNTLHSIWLGGPLRDVGAMGAFRANVAAAARQHRNFDVVVWTNVPREQFDAARATPPVVGGPDPLAEVRSMLVWARENNVKLINVDEVFSREAPMVLQALYKTEEAKQIGAGYAAASDILRIEILKRFGGVYSDGDNAATARLAGEVQRIVDSSSGFAVGVEKGETNNAVLVSLAGHRFLDAYQQSIAETYTRTPYENIMRNAALAMGEREQLGPAQPDRGIGPWVLEHSLPVTREEVIYRTGPSTNVFTPLAVKLGLDSRQDLPTVREGVFTVGSGNSWLPDGKAGVAAAVEPGVSARVLPTVAETEQAALKLAASLVHEMHSQPGNLNLAKFAPVVDRHGDPHALWDAVLGLIASHSQLRDKVSSVTLGIFDDRNRQSSSLDLPPFARALIEVLDRTAAHDEVLSAHVDPARLRDPHEIAGNHVAPATALDRERLATNLSASPSIAPPVDVSPTMGAASVGTPESAVVEPAGGSSGGQVRGVDDQLISGGRHGGVGDEPAVSQAGHEDGPVPFVPTGAADQHLRDWLRWADVLGAGTTAENVVASHASGSLDAVADHVAAGSEPGPAVVDQTHAAGSGGERQRTQDSGGMSQPRLAVSADASHTVRFGEASKVPLPVEATDRGRPETSAGTPSIKRVFLLLKKVASGVTAPKWGKVRSPRGGTSTRPETRVVTDDVPSVGASKSAYRLVLKRNESVPTGSGAAPKPAKSGMYQFDAKTKKLVPVQSDKVPAAVHAPEFKRSINVDKPLPPLPSDRVLPSTTVEPITVGSDSLVFADGTVLDLHQVPGAGNRLVEALTSALDPTLLAAFGLVRGSNEETAAALRQWLGERLREGDLPNRLPVVGEHGMVSAKDLREVSVSLQPAQDIEVALAGALSTSGLTPVQHARLLVHRPQQWDDAFTAVVATVAARELGVGITVVDPTGAIRRFGSDSGSGVIIAQSVDHYRVALARPVRADGQPAVKDTAPISAGPNSHSVNAEQAGRLPVIPEEGSTPPNASSADHGGSTVRPPWYVSGGALGDGYVVQGPKFGPGVVGALVGRLVAGVPAGPVRNEMDAYLRNLFGDTSPEHWNDLLLQGHSFMAHGSRVELSFRLAEESIRYVEPLKTEDGLRQYVSKYGDTLMSKAQGQVVSSFGDVVVDPAINLLTAGALSHVAPFLRIEGRSGRFTHETVAMEVQSGNRSIGDEVHFNSQVEVRMVVGDGAPVTVVPETGLRVAFPRTFSRNPADAPLDDARAVRVTNPAALHTVDDVVNAAMVHGLVNRVREVLDGAGLAAKSVQKLVGKIAKEAFNEKVFKDRGPWAKGGSWVTPLFTADGDQVYFVVGLRLATLEPVDISAASIRNDVADTTTVAAGKGHASEAKVAPGVDFGVAALPGGMVTPGVSVYVGSKTQYTRNTVSQGQAKFATMRGGNEVRYRARVVVTVDPHSTKRNLAAFTHDMEMEFGVPERHARDFELMATGQVFTPGLGKAGDPPVTYTKPPSSGNSATATATTRNAGASTGLGTTLKHSPVANMAEGIVRFFGGEGTRPFPKSGWSDGHTVRALTKIARRGPIEVSVPDGFDVTVTGWPNLTEHPNVTLMRGDGATLAHGHTPVYRYVVNSRGEVSGAYRMDATPYGLRKPVEWIENPTRQGQHVSAELPVRIYLPAEVADFIGSHGPIQLEKRGIAGDSNPRVADWIAWLFAHPMVQVVNHDGMFENVTLSDGMQNWTWTTTPKPARYRFVVHGDFRIEGPLPPLPQKVFPLLGTSQPLALAARSGLGPGVTRELSGAQDIFPLVREMVVDGLTGSGVYDGLSIDDRHKLDHELAITFGVPAIRAKFPTAVDGAIDFSATYGNYTVVGQVRAKLGALLKAQADGEVTVDGQGKGVTGLDAGTSKHVSFGGSFSTRFRVGITKTVSVDAPTVDATVGRFSAQGLTASTAVKEYRRERTRGGVQLYDFDTKYTITVALSRGSGAAVSTRVHELSNDLSDPTIQPRYVTRVTVSEEHLPEKAAAVADFVGVGTAKPLLPPSDIKAQPDATKEWLAGQLATVLPGRDGGAPVELVLANHGVQGFQPTFVGVHALADLVLSHIGQETGQFGDLGRSQTGFDVAANRLGATEQVLKTVNSGYLRSNFGLLTVGNGAVIPLSAKNGVNRALVLKLQVFNPVHVRHSDAITLEHYTEADARFTTTSDVTYSGEVSVGAGVITRVGNESQQTAVNGVPSRSAANQIAVHGSGQLNYGRGTFHIKLGGGLDLSLGTYGGRSQNYRADALYEVTLFQWRDGLFKRSLTTESVYLAVPNGLTLNVPHQQALDHGLPVPAAAMPPVVTGDGTGRREYVMPDLPPRMAYIERLPGAEGVLPAIEEQLVNLGLLRAEMVGVPTDVWRGLGSAFSEGALRAQSGALTSTGVPVLINLSTPYGTRRIGIVVKATIEPGGYVRSRPEVRVTTGGQAFFQSSDGTHKSFGGGGAVGVSGRAGLPNHDRFGVAVTGRLDWEKKWTNADTHTSRDIRRATAKDGSEEFEHNVTFQVDIYHDVKLKELLDMPGQLLSLLGSGVDLLTGRRAGALINEYFPPTQTRAAASAQVNATGRVLVPQSLTRVSRPSVSPAQPVLTTTLLPKIVPGPARLNAVLAPVLQVLNVRYTDYLQSWAPAVTLPAAMVTLGRQGAPGTREEVQTGPVVPTFEPTTQKGTVLTLALNEPNLRSGVDALARHQYEVPLSDGTKLTIGMNIDAARWITSGGFDALNFPENAHEPESEIETSFGWSANTAFNGGGERSAYLMDTAASLPGYGRQRTKAVAASTGDYVETNLQRSGLFHYYEMDVTWVIKGPSDHAVVVSVTRGLFGMVPDTKVNEIAAEFPAFQAPANNENSPEPSHEEQPDAADQHLQDWIRWSSSPLGGDETSPGVSGNGAYTGNAASGRSREDS